MENILFFITIVMLIIAFMLIIISSLLSKRSKNEIVFLYKIKLKLRGVLFAIYASFFIMIPGLINLLFSLSNETSLILLIIGILFFLYHKKELQKFKKKIYY